MKRILLISLMAFLIIGCMPQNDESNSRLPSDSALIKCIIRYSQLDSSLRYRFATEKDFEILSKTMNDGYTIAFVKEGLETLRYRIYIFADSKDELLIKRAIDCPVDANSATPAIIRTTKVLIEDKEYLLLCGFLFEKFLNPIQTDSQILAYSKKLDVRLDNGEVHTISVEKYKTFIRMIRSNSRIKDISVIDFEGNLIGSINKKYKIDYAELNGR